MVENAFAPYFDDTLADRVEAAETAWMEEAQAAIDAQINPAVLAAVREQATTRLAELESAIADLNEQLNLATDGFDLSLGRVRRRLRYSDARAEGPQSLWQR